MADEREQQIRERLAAATPGPWRWANWSTVFGTKEEPPFLTLEAGMPPENGVPQRGRESTWILGMADDDIEPTNAALIANAPADLAYLLDALAVAREEKGPWRGLVERMLPLVNHSDRLDCPMAFHRSSGEQCTCGALDVVREARAALAREDGG